MAVSHASADDAVVQFEEAPVPAIQVLGLSYENRRNDSRE
jgi:hypothetical protein